MKNVTGVPRGCADITTVSRIVKEDSSNISYSSLENEI